MAKGKKASSKKPKSKKSNGISESALPASGAGDLRLVEAHVKALRAGRPEGERALMLLGRDASHLVIQIAESSQDAELLTFGRRLVAVRPQIETNLTALRHESVERLIRKAQASAPNATEAGPIPVRGGVVAFFDPERVSDALTSGGRPRMDPVRVAAGDIAWFGAGSEDPVLVENTTKEPAEGQEVLRLRLAVSTGIVFVGPPQSADGPRLGTVRLDPFSTGLDAHVAMGRFVRAKPGAYLLRVHALGPDRVRVHWSAAPEGATPEAVDLAHLQSIPPPMGPQEPS